MGMETKRKKKINIREELCTDQQRQSVMPKGRGVSVSEVSSSTLRKGKRMA